MHRDPIANLTARMKIAVVSPQRATLEQVRAHIEAWDGALQVTLHLHKPELAARAAEQDEPDVLLVESAGHDHAELEVFAPLVARHPGMAVVLLSANQSAEFLRQAMRIGLRDVLPLPPGREALVDALSHARQRVAPAGQTARRSQLLCFVGCKGGSGATFLATNLAYLLAEQEQKKVALIDLNLQFGDAALYVTHRAVTTTVAEVSAQMHRLDGAMLASSMMQVLPNFHLLPAPEEPEQALRVRPECIEPLLALARAHYEIVVVDAGRSLDDVTVRAMDAADTLFLVLQLNLPSLRDAKRLLTALTALGYSREKIRVLVNRYRKGTAIALEDVTETLRRDVFMAIPNSFDAVGASVDQGVPIFKLAPRDPVARALREIAATLVESKKEEGGWLRNVLSRR
jgi:pilus assembly protein CpaE